MENMYQGGRDEPTTHAVRQSILSVDITAAIGRKRFLDIKQQGHGRDTSISMVSSLQRF
jgi:hypothetical protein